MTFSKTIAAAVVTLAIAGCTQQEEEVVMVNEEPIFAKDGTIIGMRPVVTGGMSDDVDSFDELGSASDTGAIEDDIAGVNAATDRNRIRDGAATGAGSNTGSDDDVN